jgi:hypothetical protein
MCQFILPLFEALVVANLPICLQEDVENRLLSSAQLETLVYSNMRFNGPRLPGSGEHSSEKDGMTRMTKHRN